MIHCRRSSHKNRVTTQVTNKQIITTVDHFDLNNIPEMQSAMISSNTALKNSDIFFVFYLLASLINILLIVPNSASVFRCALCTNFTI